MEACWSMSGSSRGLILEMKRRGFIPEFPSQELWQRSRPVAPTLSLADPIVWHEVAQVIESGVVRRAHEGLTFMLRIPLALPSQNSIGRGQLPISFDSFRAQFPRRVGLTRQNNAHRPVPESSRSTAKTPFCSPPYIGLAASRATARGACTGRQIGPRTRRIAPRLAPSDTSGISARCGGRCADLP